MSRAKIDHRSEHGTIEIMGIPFDAVTLERAADIIVENIEHSRGGRVVTPNVDGIRISISSKEIAECVRTANLILADGMPVVWASRLLRTPLPERVAGSDLSPLLAERAASRGIGLFLLGGGAESGQRAKDRLERRYPSLRVGFHCPPFGFERDEAERAAVDAAVGSFGPCICLVGLGFPKQELLARELLERYPSSWFLGVGGTIGFLADEFDRAPGWLRRSGFEWVHRLAKEPRRLADRYLRKDIPFALHLFGSVLRERISRRRREPVLYISWGAPAGRSAEIALELGGTSYCCFPPSSRWSGLPPTLRYALAAARTTVTLIHRRPRALVVTNPPVFAGILAAIYGRSFGAPVVLDDHPGSFGAQGYDLGRRLLPLHRRLVPHVQLCTVSDETWVAVVEQWGGRALVLHEAPGDWVPRRSNVPGHPRIVFVCTFARDEPVESLIRAADYLSERQRVEIVVTGDTRRAAPGLVEGAPSNVSFVGLLPFADYRELIYSSTAVVALTTEPTSAMRSAFEAVWAERPLLVTDWPLLRELFPDAVHVRNVPESIAGGISSLVDNSDALGLTTQAARARQLARWQNQLAILSEAVRPPREKGWGDFHSTRPGEGR